jgi:hypothetical protein
MPVAFVAVFSGGMDIRVHGHAVTRDQIAGDRDGHGLTACAAQLVRE